MPVLLLLLLLSLEDDITLPFRSGPVTKNLDCVLNSHKIAIQAYHGRSFVGNHCHRYLQQPVYEDLCGSVVKKTYELTDSSDCHQKAEDVSQKFQTLNMLFARVHTCISYAKPFTEDMHNPEHAIIEYMGFFRQHFKDVKIIPKQHILECHCLPWIEQSVFGLGFHGEQGGESSHAAVNRTKRKSYGLKGEEEKLRYIMKEQLTHTSPVMQSSPAKQKKLSE